MLVSNRYNGWPLEGSVALVLATTQHQLSLGYLTVIGPVPPHMMALSIYLEVSSASNINVRCNGETSAVFSEN